MNICDFDDPVHTWLLLLSSGGTYHSASVHSCSRDVPDRSNSTEASAVTKRKPYSPFQNTTTNADYALARVDDLVNWARKVYTFSGFYSASSIDFQDILFKVYYSAQDWIQYMHITETSNT